MYDILINEKGGTALTQEREVLESLIHTHLGDKVRSLHFAAGPAMGEALEKILETKPAHVLIGGGDGSICLSGATCMEQGVPFGIIPLGTMNLLANDLNIPTDLEECLRAYGRSRIITIDAGSVNGRHFFCNTIIGVVPEAAVARENMRDIPSVGTWAALAETVIADMGSDKVETMHVRMRNIQRTLRAKSIIVSNNAYTENPKTPTDRLSRKNLKDGKLVIYTAAPKGYLQSLRLLLRLWLGHWQKDPSIHSFIRKEIVLDAASHELLVSIDGEPISLSLPLQFRIHPRAAQIVVPA